MRFLDTNLLLRYMTRDDERKATAVLELLRRVERNEEKVVASPLVIFETVYTLETYYRVSRKEIRELVSPIIDLRGLVLDSRDVLESALELYATKRVSFADAYNACFMEKRGIEEIYSYDRDFDRIDAVRRVVP